MPAQSVCPQPERYEELASGRLPPAETEPLLQHAEGCERCAGTLGALLQRDKVLEMLRQSGPQSDDGLGEALAGLIARLSKMGPGEPATLAPAENTLPPQMLTFPCPSCHKPLKVRESLAGKKVKCPHCQQAVSAPTAGPDLAETGLCRPLAVRLVRLH